MAFRIARSVAFYCSSNSPLSAATLACSNSLIASAELHTAKLQLSSTFAPFFKYTTWPLPSFLNQKPLSAADYRFLPLRLFGLI